MHPYVIHNDALLPIEQCRLSPGQAGVINGWGLFTTARTYRGVPFRLDKHFARLQRDAKLLEIPIPVTYEQVRERLMRLSEANHLDDACVRIYFLHNKIGIWKSDEAFPTVDLVMYSLDTPTRSGPTQLALFEHGRYSAHPLTGTKVTSWLNNAWMVETQAHQRGFDDVLLLNERNEISECTAANIYLVKDGKVSTPPLNAGCLAGVSRLTLMELAKKAGTPVVERAIPRAELDAADEVFITSTTRQVQPVDRVEDNKWKAPGPVTERLAKLFDDYVHEYIANEQRSLAHAK
ncbi:MAG: aminotransferase class IV [Terriglobales bacterium]